jgi:hypothetical protein
LLDWIKKNAWGHIDLNLPPSERRQAGFWFLAGFAVIGAVLAWKSEANWNSQGARVVWAIGAVAGFGTMAPGVGRHIYIGTMGVFGLIGAVMSSILLTIMFYLVFTPAALVLRLLSKDLLDRKSRGQAHGAESAWREHKTPSSMRQYRRMS